jgi:hypothetical protein
MALIKKVLPGGGFLNRDVLNASFKNGYSLIKDEAGHVFLAKSTGIVKDGYTIMVKDDGSTYMEK